jgi:hypothetical protein
MECLIMASLLAGRCQAEQARLWPALPSPGFYPEISGFFEAVGIFLGFLFLDFFGIF